MNGVSLQWFSKVFSGTGIVDIGAAFKRSLKLGLVVMVLTVVLSVSAGMAFRKSFRGASSVMIDASPAGDGDITELAPRNDLRKAMPAETERTTVST